MSGLKLFLSQSTGIFYRNLLLNKLMVLLLVLYLGIEYFYCYSQKTYASTAVLGVMTAFYITFQSAIVINLSNDRANGFLDLYMSMGLSRTPYILCQIFTFSLFALIMQCLVYLLYFIYFGKVDSILPENFLVSILFMISLLPMVLIFAFLVRSPNYSRGIVTLVNLFMYIYGASFAFDTSNNSALALFMPHFHYANFVVEYYRQHPQFGMFIAAIDQAHNSEPSSHSNYSQKLFKKYRAYNKVSLVVLFFLYLVIYVMLVKVFDEGGVDIPKMWDRFKRWVRSKCSKKRDQATDSQNVDTSRGQIENDPEDFYSNVQWNFESEPSVNKSGGASLKNTDMTQQTRQHFNKNSGNYLILKNISKYFESFPALTNVHIALKKGEVTCLLGHNGAGKSTLINILTGFQRPTFGDILWEDQIMYGGDSQAVNLLRSVGIGICTSKDILYDSMTVYQHLKLACYIKGLRGHKKQISDILEKLNLVQYQYFKVSKLSGGNKRKLSIAIAMIGDPKIIFLDEPTSALDPVSRREILSILAKLKSHNDRVILLTTHHLEEAELLADFVVVLSRGKAVESGSLLKLKTRFGVGVQIKMSRKMIKSKGKVKFQFSKVLRQIEALAKTLGPEIGRNMEILQHDNSSLVIKTAGISDSNIVVLLEKLQNQMGRRFYIAVNSTTFDDIFCEIDRIYEKSTMADEAVRDTAFTEFSNYIKEESEDPKHDKMKKNLFKSVPQFSQFLTLTKQRLVTIISNWKTALKYIFLYTVILILCDRFMKIDFSSPPTDMEMGKYNMSHDPYNSNNHKYNNAYNRDLFGDNGDHMKRHNEIMKKIEQIESRRLDNSDEVQVNVLHGNAKGDQGLGETGQGRILKEKGYRGYSGAGDVDSMENVMRQELKSAGLTDQDIDKIMASQARHSSQNPVKKDEGKTRRQKEQMQKEFEMIKNLSEQKGSTGDMFGEDDGESFSKTIGDSLEKKKVHLAFFIVYFFELSIMNIFLLGLLKEKVNKIKTVIYSNRASPFVYYLSRLLGDVFFNLVLYSVIYLALYLGAYKILVKYEMFSDFNDCFSILLVWKLRYVFIGYLISHLFYSSIERILKFYLFIYSLINSGAIILHFYFPNVPIDLVFDSGDIWGYVFYPDYQVKKWRLLTGLLVDFVLALVCSTVLDNFFLSRNYRGQKKSIGNFRVNEVEKRYTIEENLNNSYGKSFNSSEPKASLMQQSFSTSMILNNDIKIRDLSKTYGLCFKNQVLDRLSFDISEREAFGLVGPNGSGKSTTFNILTAELAKSSGHLFSDGNLAFSLCSPSSTLFWQQNLGICFQNNFLYDHLTLEQHIDFYANLNGFRYYIKAFADEFCLDLKNDPAKTQDIGEELGRSEQTECEKDSGGSGDSIEMEEMVADRQDMEVIKETKSELEDHDSTQKESNYSHFSELDTSSADLLSSKSSKLSAQKSRSEQGPTLPTVRKRISRNPYIEHIELALDIQRFRKTKAKNLSSGNQRKLCILISLLKDVKTCLWDEATCGLDVLARYNIRQLLFVLKREKQAKMLITTHFLNDIDLYCDKIGILKNKRFGFLGSTEMLKNEYGGYCVLARGRSKGLKRFLDGMKAISNIRILEHKHLSDTNEDNQAGNPQNQNERSQPRISVEAESFGVRNRGGIGSQPIRRESLDVRLADSRSHSMVKLHVEKFGTATRLFKELQGNVARGNIFEFFMNQYNVEHIYVDLMKRLETQETD